MRPQVRLAGCIIALFALAVVTPATAEETPKSGGILTYMIPADAPPSFDGHREATYATVHSAAPFYSVFDPGRPEEPVFDL
jgi:peptide/nickel transport system substrate-binding protein